MRIRVLHTGETEAVEYRVDRIEIHEDVGVKVEFDFAVLTISDPEADEREERAE